MTGFLDKLNVLVKSSLNNFLGEAASRTTARLPQIPAERLSKDIDQEIAALRARIDQAVSEEDAMQKRLEDIQAQIRRFDQQADQAVQNGDDATARQILQQMRRQEQLEAMLKAELEEHRQVTSDFIQRVNTLDSIVSDARREHQADQTETEDSQPDHAPGAVLSNLLRDARERFENTLSSATQPSQHDETPSGAAGGQDAHEDQQVDEDLAKRRARLSKPD